VYPWHSSRIRLCRLQFDAPVPRDAPRSAPGAHDFGDLLMATLHAADLAHTRPMRRLSASHPKSALGCGPCRGKFGIRVKSGHKPNWRSSKKVYLAGRRTPFHIQLKTIGFLSTLGGTISGHPDGLSKAGFWPGYWARLSRKSKSLVVNAFRPSNAIVTTFYTYPEPTPNSFADKRKISRTRIDGTNLAKLKILALLHNRSITLYTP
jgi:hypothetical protein